MCLFDILVFSYTLVKELRDFQESASHKLKKMIMIFNNVYFKGNISLINTHLHSIQSIVH